MSPFLLIELKLVGTFLYMNPKLTDNHLAIREEEAAQYAHGT